MTELITPHGGKLINLMASGQEAAAIRKDAIHYKNLTLTERQICDLELVVNGTFSPLIGFLKKGDYQSVLDDMSLMSGEIWPIPVTLDVSRSFSETLNKGEKIALRDNEGVLLAILDVSDIWTPEKSEEAQKVFGTVDEKHPAVNYLMHQAGEVYIGGNITGIEYPKHYDYQLLRHSPAELREQFSKMGWTKIVAFQTRNPMHRAHVELTTRAAKEISGNLLIHPVVGMTKPGDVDHYTRVRCYQKILSKYPSGTTMMSLLPLAMRMGGPREALWHAIIRKNYGCTHLIVGRDHAGPGNDSNGNPFYGPYDAQELVVKYSDKIGIKMVPFKLMVYVEDMAGYMPVDEVPKEASVLNISGTELRRRLTQGLDIPEWFTYPEVTVELRKTYPPKSKQGFTIFFTGLSGSGKSTIANGLLVKLMEVGDRPVTLLDGDVVRMHLSSELGFSREHRDLNIKRIGYVASEITKNAGVAICAPIAPYEEPRRFNRELISQVGAYIEVHISTSLEECERRDVKGLYAKARKGIIKGFTGIDDPYEVPDSPELRVDTADITQEQAVQQVFLYLEKEGFLG
ncbi:MAG: bifunctional sulfate adenylyltransferase/adenylylsulfate kinase [Candidatus Marinimicrobia bacterium]|nr:bifunctional sulfate adenylyltransferase/adenylylsulfate kinase [Candidatus Neomarinimicrobiota bacterium]